MKNIKLFTLVLFLPFFVNSQSIKKNTYNAQVVSISETAYPENSIDEPEYSSQKAIIEILNNKNSFNIVINITEADYKTEFLSKKDSLFSSETKFKFVKPKKLETQINSSDFIFEKVNSRNENIEIFKIGDKESYCIISIDKDKENPNSKIIYYLKNYLDFIPNSLTDLKIPEGVIIFLDYYTGNKKIARVLDLIK